MGEDVVERSFFDYIKIDDFDELLMTKLTQLSLNLIEIFDLVQGCYIFFFIESELG